MSHWYTDVTRAAFSCELDLENDDLRILLVMSNTTADTEEDAVFLDDLTTLDECDGASYARQVATGAALTKDEPNNRTVFTLDNPVFADLGPGTRQVVGAVIVKWVTDPTDSPLVYYATLPPFDPPGSPDTTILWDPGGLALIEAIAS